MTQISESQRNLMIASFELGQAQRALEDAEKRFKDALAKVDRLEGLSLPNKDHDHG